MIIMYINNDKCPVNTSEFASSEEIIAVAFEIQPQLVFSELLACDYFGYINSIPEHCNNIILDGVIRRFEHIIENNFIEVLEDASFDYEYGDICSTHHEVALVGYVPRIPEFEELAVEPWEDYY